MGLKKDLPTVIDESAFAYEQIYVSAGKRGYQMLVSPINLQEISHALRGQIARP